MSTLFRLAKGTGLTLGRTFVSIVGQFLTVPIYLSHWQGSTYGVWLILQGLLGYLTLVSVAFQQYTFAEVMKTGPDQLDIVRRIYWSALGVGYIIAAMEFTVVIGFVPSAVRAALPEDITVPAETVVGLLVLFSLVQLLLMPFGAITANTMTIYGYYPRSAAWGLCNVIATMFAPAGAVLLGADLMVAGLVFVSAHAASGFLMLIDYASLARRYKLMARTAIDWREGFVAAFRCLPLAARTFIDSFRQQGFRILLGFFAGASAVTALATTRTFANVLHQGINTIIAPLMPELMRYVVIRDQDRTEGSFALVWLCLFTLLVPGVLLLCLLAEPLFLFWTRDEVGFDPILFLTLLVVVLVFAAGQPAASILQGQNQVSWMVSAALAAAAGLFLLALLLVPPYGLRGAGFALLGAELCSVAVTVAGAVASLSSRGLVYPTRSFILVVCNIAIVFGLALPAVTFLSPYSWFVAFPFGVNVFMAGLYWVSIPKLARHRMMASFGELRTRLRRWI